MKYCHYFQRSANGVEVEGVCHKSKLEYLATPGSTLKIDVIDDERYAELVEDYGGVETAPVKAPPKVKAPPGSDKIV